jgi:two-component system, chemotaxis family, CheB/CheR fusion protein
MTKRASEIGARQQPPELEKPNARLTIVGIGASAGGVQALQTLFDALPNQSGVAFVVVVHLDPESQSELPVILAAKTRMPVTQVDATTALKPDHVYIIPPNRGLRITDDEVSAHEFDEPRGKRAPIDLFFRSLADQHGDGFAIILTGAGSDGAVGVKAVKEAGGIILVQDPSEAEYPSMPRSAIATGVVDFILPVREIAARLAELARNKETVISQLRDSDEEHLRRILAHVLVRTGHDFSRYKQSTALRRIARRAQVTRQDKLADYYTYLRDNVEEVQALFSDLLISVTTFFRDAKAFEALAQHVIPQLFRTSEKDGPLRVWVPGCATGEEAYTVGILLLEEAARRDIRPEFQLFGSDLDAGSLAIAREGRYPMAIETDISEERLRRFFLREGDHYRVKRDLREVVLFASHSVLKDPPFSHLDFISCRNLLIYLDRELQQQACSTFHYALKPNGYLFLGSSESADSPPNLFRTIDKGARIYQAIAHTGDGLRMLPRMLTTPRVREQIRPNFSPPPRIGWSERTSHRQALEKFAPPSALVDADHRVVHLSENAGRYLQPPAGPMTSDIAELVRQELRFDLRAALYRAFERGEATLSQPLFVHFNGSPHRIYLQVRPVQHDSETGPRQALVLFIEGGAVEEASEHAPMLPEEHRAIEETIRQLKDELRLTQGRLRATREDSEAANEELRAANEELQSINEEYRSTSEELETSKEELQSINEELQTVNNELKLKLEGVSRAHSDLQNLMAATDVGILFLDPALRIKRFTPRVTDLFNIKQTDEGRPITDFTHQLEYESFADDAQTVLAHLAPIQRGIHARKGGWYQMRLRPYRTVDDKIDGLVVSFVDITERHRVEEALTKSDENLRHATRLVKLSRAPIFVWDFDGGIVEWNRGSEELYGYSREEARGQKKDALLKTSVPSSSFDELKKHLLNNGSWSGELQQKTKDGRELTVEAQLELVSFGGCRLVLESTRDVTERKAWERRQQLLLGELTHRVKNTLAVVQSIANLTLQGSYSSAEFIESFHGRLGALARAHELLIASNWQGAELEALARDQLQPYISENSERVRIEGEPVTLPARIATPLGLMLHELATNAVKHGSLKDPAGSVSLTWRIKPENERRVLAVVWREQGERSVTNPEKSGFGMFLIEKGLPDASVRHTFRPEGVVCTIKLPMATAIEY